MQKSMNYDEFTITEEHKFNLTKAFIVDDGYLLYAIQDLPLHLHAVRKLFEKQFEQKHVTAIFNHYDDLHIMENSEQLCRYQHITPLFRF